MVKVENMIQNKKNIRPKSANVRDRQHNKLRILEGFN